MSVHVMALVFRASEATLASRLVLLALADAAHDDGVTWIGQELLAEKSKIAEPSVRRCIRDLEAIREVETRKAQRGRKRINVYRVTLPGVLDPDYDRLPFAVSPFTTTAQYLRPSETDDRASVRADDRTPSYAREEDPEEREPSRAGPPRSPAVVRPKNRPATVDRQRVTDAEYELAVAILAVFNEIAETNYKSKDWVAKVVARIREQPDLELDDHRRVIRSAFANRWWNDPPSPSVVYGNAGLFERTLVAATHAAADAGDLSAEEIATFMSEWGPGTPYATLAAARADREADVELDDDQVREDPS
jgi:hypothetical protein